MQRYGRSALIVNADDWGLNKLATDRTLECVLRGSVSSVSAMVFMEDSERAAQLARQHDVDAGLHLNLSVPLVAANCPAELRRDQMRLTRFLRRHRLAPAIFHPLLARTFRRVVEAQIAEFERIYGHAPARIDGHHHMHLCANVLNSNLLPRDAMVRRNLSFFPGQKSGANRAYRARQDRRIATRHATTDYFFDLRPMDCERLKRLHSLSEGAAVEVECHPEREDEYRFLTADGIENCLGRDAVARGYDLYARHRRIADPSATAQSVTRPHICVCVCTWKRPEPLRRLLGSLAAQQTEDQFTFSVAVADNDAAGSARSVVEEFRAGHSLHVDYCVEPRSGIAHCRNAVVALAQGDYLAFIDDDEFAMETWLLRLLEQCQSFAVDGMLGPVKNFYDGKPPEWLRQCELLDRRIWPTGTPVQWLEARTGNVLLRAELAKREAAPFRTEFATGEDQDFFRRCMERGARFLWSVDAVAWEVVPPERWTRRYYWQRSLRNGSISRRLTPLSAKSVAKSVAAIATHGVQLPLRALQGGHRWMDASMRLGYHLGRLFVRGN